MVSWLNAIARAEPATMSVRHDPSAAWRWRAAPVLPPKMPRWASWTSTSTWPGPGRLAVMTRSSGWWAKSGTPQSSVGTRRVPITALVSNVLRAVTETTFGSLANWRIWAGESTT